MEIAEEFEGLAKDTRAIVRAKTILQPKTYKNKDKAIKVKCPKCENEFADIVGHGL